MTYIKAGVSPGDFVQFQVKAVNNTTYKKEIEYISSKNETTWAFRINYVSEGNFFILEDLI